MSIEEFPQYAGPEEKQDKLKKGKGRQAHEQKEKEQV
jgi:hypothetical protein